MTFVAKPAVKSSLTLALVLALAACGGSADQASEPTGSEAPAASEGALPEAGATPAPETSPTPGATPSEAPTATPSPTPTATTAAAAPAPAAAATPPPMFAVCAACHSVEPGKTGIGPSLANVFGARAASQPGFDYSEAMESSGLTWNQANLDRFLADPKGVVPGTSMAYAGVKNAAQRQAIIDYLKGL